MFLRPRVAGRRDTLRQVNTNTDAMQPEIPFQLLDPEVIENPYPFYAALLEQAPVYQVPGTQVYLVSSWKLIHQVLKNQRDYSANLTGILITGDDGQPELFDLTSFGGSVDAIANADEPFHAVHRRLVLPQLNARKVESMEREVREWAVSGVSRLIAGGGGDCVGELANAIPVMVMARLAGLPVTDLDQLLGWAFSGGDILAGTCTLERMAQLSTATSQMSAYLKAHYDNCFASGESGEPQHVLAELVRGVREGLISERDAIAILVVLVGAAGESTSSLIGSAIRILARDGELQQRLRETPALVDNFVEEVVRLESPFKGHYRAVLHDTELAGVHIPAQARVFLLWAAANRDPSVFPRPDRLDIERRNIGEHLGFGHGIHFCIGARLARMEARIVLQELLRQSDSFSLDKEHQVKHVQSIFVRRLAQLQLRCSPRLARA